MTVSSVSCCPASYVQNIQEKRRKNSWVLLSCHQFVQIRIWRWCESSSVSQTFAALSQSWELLGMLCKLWKCWNSCTELSRNGLEHLVALMAGFSACHIRAVQVKRVLCALRSGALYLSDKELGTGSCWKTACVKCGLLNCCPFPATALRPSQSCHILNLQMSCTENHPSNKIILTFSSTEMSDVTLPEWVQAAQPRCCGWQTALITHEDKACNRPGIPAEAHEVPRPDPSQICYWSDWN